MPAGQPDQAHLGRHVVEGAGAREGQLLVRLDGQPKVAQLERQRCCEEDVLRLDVPTQSDGAWRVLLTASFAAGEHMSPWLEIMECAGPAHCHHACR